MFFFSILSGDENTAVCRLFDVNRVDDVINVFTMNFMVKECDCLPDCFSISWEMETSQAQYYKPKNEDPPPIPWINFRLSRLKDKRASTLLIWIFPFQIYNQSTFNFVQRKLRYFVKSIGNIYDPWFHCKLRRIAGSFHGNIHVECRRADLLFHIALVLQMEATPEDSRQFARVRHLGDSQSSPEFVKDLILHCELRRDCDRSHTSFDWKWNIHKFALYVCEKRCLFFCCF